MVHHLRNKLIEQFQTCRRNGTRIISQSFYARDTYTEFRRKRPASLPSPSLVTASLHLPLSFFPPFRPPERAEHPKSFPVFLRPFRKELKSEWGAEAGPSGVRALPEKPEVPSEEEGAFDFRASPPRCALCRRRGAAVAAVAAGGSSRVDVAQDWSDV